MISQELCYYANEQEKCIISDKQSNKIIESIKNNPVEFMQSKFYQELLKDKRLF